MNKVGNLYRLFACLTCWFGLWSGAANAQDPSSEDWKTGIKLDQQLMSPISVRWSGQELRTALQNLSAAQHIAIILDRRIDPGQTLELSINDLMLIESMQEIADAKGLGFTLLDAVSYFGPPEAAADLRTLAQLAREEAEKVPVKQRAVLLERKALNWPDLARPRDLIKEIIEEAGLKLVGLERVPHDLWPAGSWPPMTLLDRLSLLAIGFDLQVRVSKDGSTLALVPRMKPALIVRSYPLNAKTKQLQERIAERLPDAEFKLTEDKLYVRGRLEDQEVIEASLSGSSAGNNNTAGSTPGEAPVGTKVYTLTIMNQPLLPVVKALAKQMKLEVALDEEVLKSAGIDPAMRISFEVKEVTADNLWEAALKPAGLTFQMDGDVLNIYPATQE